MRLLLAIIIFIVGYAVYLLIRDEKRRRKDIEDNLLREVAKSFLDDIRKATTQFLHLSNGKIGYFTNYKFQVWRKAFTELYEKSKPNRFKDIGLEAKEVSDIESFLNYFENGESLRGKFNSQFIKDELIQYSTYFDNIEGRKLDLQQRTAIITD